MSKHTPGLWTVNTVRQVAGCNGDIAVTLDSGTIVAVAYARMGRPDETLANANLLAAAPDLLGAAQAALSAIEWLCSKCEQWGDGECFDSSCAVHEAVARVEAAVAKAEGRAKE